MSVFVLLHALELQPSRWPRRWAWALVGLQLVAFVLSVPQFWAFIYLVIAVVILGSTQRSIELQPLLRLFDDGLAQAGAMTEPGRVKQHFVVVGCDILLLDGQPLVIYPDMIDGDQRRALRQWSRLVLART